MVSPAVCKALEKDVNEVKQVCRFEQNVFDTSTRKNNRIDEERLKKKHLNNEQWKLEKQQMD